MRRAALLLALLLISTPSASRAATLVNGSFEPAAPTFAYQLLAGGSSAIPGWVTTDTGVEWYRPADFGNGPAAHGAYVLDLANYTYSAGGVQQTFATLPGETIAVQFMFGSLLGSGRDGTAQIEVSADGQTQTFSTATTSSTIAWTPRTFTFTADDGSATLRFRCLQNAYLHFAMIDGASLQQVTPARMGTWGRIKSLYR